MNSKGKNDENKKEKGKKEGKFSFLMTQEKWMMKKTERIVVIRNNLRIRLRDNH